MKTATSNLLQRVQDFLRGVAGDHLHLRPQPARLSDALASAAPTRRTAVAVASSSVPPLWERVKDSTIADSAIIT